MRSFFRFFFLFFSLLFPSFLPFLLFSLVLVLHTTTTLYLSHSFHPRGKGCLVLMSPDGLRPGGGLPPSPFTPPPKPSGRITHTLSTSFLLLFLDL
ncbi:hypothetical protein DFJ73DRAFT_890521, partial [Zopfochytrium polystomum]